MLDDHAIRKRISEKRLITAAYNQINDLRPTSRELQAYIETKKMNQDQGLVKQSKSSGKGEIYSVRLHDAGKIKKAGRFHIDMAYLNEKLMGKDVPDTAHILLSKTTAPEFIEFIVTRRTAKKQR